MVVETPEREFGSIAVDPVADVGLRRPTGATNVLILQARVVARPLHLGLGMTRFDRTWEPLFVLVASLVLLVGTL